MTIVLVTGALLTAANIGDSAAVLDTGCSMLELTDSHRIQVRGVYPREGHIPFEGWGLHV